MKLKCTCGAEFDGGITLKDTWTGFCPKCKNEFPIQVPGGKYIMAFTDPVDGSEEPYKFFTDNFNGEHIVNYFAFDTPQELIKEWVLRHDKPNGMWYWLMDGDRCFCSGACDPGDIELIENHFGLKAINDEWFPNPRKGTLFTEKVVDDFMNVLPPACMRGNCSQLGEPHSHVPAGGYCKPTYITFKRIKRDIWEFCGYCFRGENTEPEGGTYDS